MKTDKQTFVFRLEWAQVLKQQPDSIRLAVYDAIIDYVQTGKEPPQQSAVYFAFLFIKNQIDKDTAKYEEVCAKRAEAGKKHKGNQHTINRNKLEQMEQVEQVFQNGTNGTDNDNEYDSDNNNVNNNNPLTPLKGETVKQPKFNPESFLENEPAEKRELLMRWINYKKMQFRQTYKSDDSFKTFVKKLERLSGGNLETAKAIIEQSIANTYQGIFELKKSAPARRIDTSERDNRNFDGLWNN